MLIRILEETFLRRKRRVALTLLAVLLGSTLAAALLGVWEEILGKLSLELRAYGSNIIVTPPDARLQVEALGLGQDTEGAYLDEEELPKLKAIFWRNNILGFAPYLSLVVSLGEGRKAVLTGTWFEKELSLPSGSAIRTGFSEAVSLSQGQRFRTGLKAISPWWRLRGEWVGEEDHDSAILGAALAESLRLSLGDSFTIEHAGHSRELRVKGIVSTGGYEENQIFVNLPLAQELLGISKGVQRVLVSALTLPKGKLAADIRDKRPEEMTPEQYEKWYCSPVIEAITTQIQEVLSGAEARPIRRVSEAEGRFALKMQWMILLITAVALLTSALGVMTTMTTMVLERRAEIGLMKAIGAENSQIATIFLLEAGIIGTLGGLLGYLSGLGLARFIGLRVFSTAIQPSLGLLPIILLLAVGVSLLGSALPVRRAVAISAAGLLRGL